MSVERRTPWGTPVEHEHVITYRHHGREEIRATCGCGESTGRYLPREKAEAFAVEHRRAMGLLDAQASRNGRVHGSEDVL